MDVLQDINIIDKAFEWAIIILAISGIGYGIYKGVEEGIGSALFGFFGVFCIGGAAIGIILPPVVGVWWVFLNPKAVANYIPFFGWFFVSTGYAISVFAGVHLCRNEMNKALTILFLIPFFYTSFVTITLLALFLLAIPISIFHACVGTASVG